MTDEKIKRINELTAISRTREFTEEEQTERAALRKEYIEEWRRGTIEAFETTGLTGPGKKRPLPKKYRS